MNKQTKPSETGKSPQNAEQRLPLEQRVAQMLEKIKAAYPDKTWAQVEQEENEALLKRLEAKRKG